MTPADLWNVGGRGGDCGATSRLRGNSLGAGHRCPIFVHVCPINCHLQTFERKLRISSGPCLHQVLRLLLCCLELNVLHPACPLHPTWLSLIFSSHDFHSVQLRHTWQWQLPENPYLRWVIGEGLGLDKGDLCGGDASGQRVGGSCDGDCLGLHQRGLWMGAEPHQWLFAPHINQFVPNLELHIVKLLHCMYHPSYHPISSNLKFVKPPPPTVPTEEK